MEDIADLLHRGRQARREHRPEDAVALFTRVLELAPSSSLEAAKAHSSLGQVQRDLRDLDSAIQHYTEAASIYQALKDPLAYAHTIRHIGDILTDQGALAMADSYFTKALVIYRVHPDAGPLDIANAIRGHAVLKQQIGAVGDARALWQEAHDIYKSLNIQSGVAESSRHIAMLDQLDSSR